MVAAVMGWLGTAGTFLAYALLCRGRLSAQSRRYAALNTAGGLLGGTACVIYGAWPSAASNLAWAALGLHALSRTFRAGRPYNRVARLQPTPDHTPGAASPATVS